MARSGEEGILVETGTFRIDRKRALEKMRAFQLSNASSFLLFVLRSAEAAGASRVDVETFDGGLKVLFNGEPFPNKSVDEPFGAIFDEAGATPSAPRQFAIAALAFLRGPGAGVSLCSGKGSRPRAVEISEDFSSTPRRDARRPDRSWWVTQLLFHAPGLKKAFVSMAVRQARSEKGYRFGSAAVTIDGVRLEESGGVVDRGRPGFMARLRRAKNLDAVLGRVQVFYLGAYLQDYELSTSWGQVAGDVRFDDAKLDASMSKIVAGESIKRLEEEIGGAVRALVEREAAIQNERIGAIGESLRNPRVRKRWEQRLDPFDGAATYLMTRLGMSVFKDLKARDQFRDDLHRTVWLRQACAGRLKNYNAERRAAPARSLWRCKLFFSVDLKPLSVFDIERIRVESSGRIRVRRNLDRAWDSYEVVWAPADHDLAALRALFGDSAIMVIAQK